MTGQRYNSGYSSSPIGRKIGVKAGMAVFLIDPPAGYAEALANPNSILQIHLAGVESTDDKLEMVFLSSLNRYPTDAERRLFAGEIATGRDAAFDAILWVLLNSQQFRFVN